MYKCHLYLLNILQHLILFLIMSTRRTVFWHVAVIVVNCRYTYSKRYDKALYIYMR